MLIWVFDTEVKSNRWVEARFTLLFEVWVGSKFDAVDTRFALLAF